jgi:hypothetical protein
MLPYTGTFAQLGVAITNGFKLAVEERGGKLGGREIEYVTVDDESNPAKATENVNKLVQRDKVDVVIGTVHSGVVMGMAKVAEGIRHTLDQPQRRCRRHDGGRLRAQLLPHFLLQLADHARHGQGAQGQGPQDRCLHHLEVRLRVRK